MFNKSFWAMKQDLAHGHGVGFSLFGGQGVASGDKQAILDYNTALKNGVPPAKAWATTMSNASIAAQEQTRQCIKSKGSLTELANGLQQTTVKAKGAELGLKALSVAGNMLMMMGISMAISGIIKGFQALANAQENAIEKANEFINKFEEQRDKLTSNKQAIDSMSSDYEKLAKGVDSLGRNVSLNSDEYARYNEIVNQIADMFPHMVQGYTDEGNAIIKYKGDVEKLTKAYKDQKDAAQDAIIVGSAEVFAGFKASTDKNPEYIWEESGLLQMKELVDKIVATGGDVEKIQEVINDLGGNSLVIGDVFDKIGLDKGWFDWNTQDAEYISENIKKFQSLFNTLNTEVEAQAAKIKPIMQAYLEQSEKFQLADDKVQDMVKQIVGQFDAEFYSQFDSEAQMASWVEENVIDKLRGNKGLVNDFSVMFDLQTKFNAGDITVTEYQEKLTAFLSLIDTLPDETQKAIKLLFGITTNDDGTTSSDVDTMVKNVKDKFKGKFDKEIDQLKLDELEILTNLDISPDGIKDWSEVEALIANASKEVNKMTVSLSDLEGASDKIGKLSSASKDLSDNGHITLKTLGEIQTATGLSGDEWEEYQSKLQNAKKGSAEFNQVMGDLIFKILENTFGLKGLTEENQKNIEAVLIDSGVTNANAVAQSVIARAKAENASATAVVTGKTLEEVVALVNESRAAGWTAQQINELIAKHINLNNAKLSVKDKIAAITRIGQAAGWASSYLKYMIKLVNQASGVFEDNSGLTEQEKAVRQGTSQVYLNKAGLWDTGEVPEFTPPEIATPNFSGSGGSGSSKGSGSGGSGSKTPFDDTYYSTVKSWIDENKKDIEKLEAELDGLNRQFENALDTGNKEQAEILRNKLAENAKMQKDILHQQNEAHRITQGNLLQSLYQYAPSLSGKSWDEISEVDLINIENALNRASETASDDNKNQAQYNLNQFKGIVDDLKTLNDTIEDNSESWWKLDDDSKGYWQSQIDFQDDYSNTWIDNQKAFDKLSEEEELAAYDRMINNNKEFQKQILNDTSISEDAKFTLIKETNDKIVEIEKNAYDLRKDIFDKANDFASSYIDSSKTLLQSYYDVTNSIAEAQHEINKELETSKTMYEWLDEDTRKLLFNQEDYNVLSEELYDIQYKADKLKRQYERDLENSTLSTVEAITSNYEMQYETLMKSYEIAKADLEIAKKKQKLNNVLNERNVRMFINGQWQWVANTQDVIDAKSELADAEYAKRVEESGLAQQKSINNLTKQQDELGVIIKKFENGVIDLDSAVDDIIKSFSKIPAYSEGKYSSISSKSSLGSSLNSNYVSWAKAQMAANSAAWHTADADAKRALESANQSLGKAIGSTYDSATGTWKHKYASGTRYTAGGMSLLGEDGFEAYINSNGRLIPINQPTIGNIPNGGVVFNTDQMRSLRTLWDMSNIDFNAGKRFVGGIQPQQIDQSQDNRIIINGMTVDSGSSDGQALISALRRYVGNH